MPTRWLGNSLAPGESELQSRPRGKETFPQSLPGTLRTESTPPHPPVLYIASSDGLVEIQFHIFNYQFSWGGEVSSPHPFLAGCWTPIAAWALPCTIYPFGLVALPPPGKGQVQGPGALLPPPHAPPCPFAQLPRYPQQWGGVTQGGVAGPVPVSI